MADAFLIRRRLMRARQGILAQVEVVLDHAIVTGRSAVATAKHVAQYLSPYFANRRSETGGLLRAARSGIAPGYPAGSGLASYPARFIAGEAITTSHGGRAILLASQTPDMGLKWTLSPGHKDKDDCDKNASRDKGWGPGVYSAEEVPVYLAHRGCRCILEPTPLRPRGG